MSTAISILAALVLLSLLVMIHELGHYFAGRALGFSILEFSIGMGPKLLKKTNKRGTEFNLRAFPIGGMCRFEGEDEAAVNERSFNAQKVWKRIIVVLAGPITNLVFAILLALRLGRVFGKDGVFSFFLLFLFSLIGYIVLAFDSSRYDRSRADA